LIAAYEKHSEKSEEKFRKHVELWYSENGDTEICKEIVMVKEQLESLKNPST